MAHVMEQADGGWIRTKRGNAKANDYHRWLKRGRNRQIRRVVKVMLQRDQEPPSKFRYHGYET